MIDKIYKRGDKFYANDINNVISNVNGNETNIKQIRNTINEDIVKTLVINVPLEDLERITNSSTTNGFPNEYLVNADLGFGMNEINAFVEGKLNVQLMTNLKRTLSDEDFILTMMLDNVMLRKIPEEENMLLNGERILYIIGLSWNNVGTVYCEFILSEHYCTAIVELINQDYSSAIAQAKQMASNAQQRADEAYNEASNVSSVASCAQLRADEAYTRADEAYNYAMGIVVPPDNSWEVQQAQSRADEAYTRADDAYNEASNAASAASSAQSTADEALGATQVTDPTNGSLGTPINDALNNVHSEALSAQQRADEAYNLASDASGCLTEMIYLMLLPFMLVRMVVYNLHRFFFTMPIGNSDGTPIGDKFFYWMYLVQKGRKDELPSEITPDVQLLMYGDRKCNICFDEQMSTFLPTLDVSGINYLNDNLEIVLTDEVTELFAQHFGIPDIAALRIIDPVQIDGEDCYWALVKKDGNVLNPGEYELNPSI